MFSITDGIEYTAPTSFPQNISISNVTSTTISITWLRLPPQERNGEILQYEVIYNPLETFDGAITSMAINTSNSTFSVVIRNLEENVNYSISLRAYTSAGEGPTSPEIFTATDEDGKTKSTIIMQKKCQSKMIVFIIHLM